MPMTTTKIEEKVRNDFIESLKQKLLLRTKG